MSSYVGRYAELYDLFYEDKSYAEEAAFVDMQIRPARRLLDVACGTGRHANAFEALGYEVVGVDASPDMVRRAQSKTSNVEFRVQDMRSLQLDGPPFDAAVCLFDSIGYALSDDGVLATLRSIRRHLRPNGKLVIEYWHAPAMLEKYSPVRIRRFRVPEGEILRLSETTVEPASRTAAVKYTILELRQDGTYGRAEETQRNRFFDVEEMDRFLIDAGFAPGLRFDGYREGACVGPWTWHVVSVAQAKA